MHMLVGDRVAKVRLTTADEMDSEGWSVPTVVLLMESGIKLYASQDEEGNGPGVMFALRGSTHLTIKP